MSKSTLFTFFLAALLMVIVAELLADQYVKNPQTVQTNTFQQTSVGADASASNTSATNASLPNPSVSSGSDASNPPFVAPSDTATPTPTPTPTSPVPAAATSSGTAVPAASNPPASNSPSNPSATPPSPHSPNQPTSTSPMTPSPAAPSNQPALNPSPNPESSNSTSPQNDPAINFELVTKAGFQDVSLQRVVFKGTLFSGLDISDAVTTPVIEQNLLQGNAKTIATFDEFTQTDANVSKELYQLIEQKAKSELGVTVNETNAFGEGSFYVNYPEYAQRAFLVVRTRKNVYALTYEKEYHPSIAKLIQLFP